MTVWFHPAFPQDVRRFESEEAALAPGLALRFRDELDVAVDTVMRAPTSAGHFLNLPSPVACQIRRRNLRSFPFFVLYGVAEDRLIFGSVIPSRSDPLTWLVRLEASRRGRVPTSINLHLAQPLGSAARVAVDADGAESRRRHLTQRKEPPELVVTHVGGEHGAAFGFFRIEVGEDGEAGFELGLFARSVVGRDALDGGGFCQGR